MGEVVNVSLDGRLTGPVLRLRRGLSCGVLIGSLLTAGGCANLVPAPPGDVPTSDELLERLRARLDGVSSLGAEARISYYGPEGARKARAVLLAERPDRLHATFLTPTDSLVAASASDGRRFTSFQWGAPVCYVGGSCPENIAPWIGLPLGGQDIVQLMFGEPLELGQRALDAAPTWDGRVGAWRLSGRQVNIWIAPESWQLRKMTAPLAPGSDGPRALSVTWEDYEDVAGVQVPHRIRVQAGGSVDLQIRYREISLNETIDPSAFSLPCPDGAEVREMPCVDPLPSETVPLDVEAADDA